MKLRLLHPQGTFKLSHQDAGRARRLSVWLPLHRAVLVRKKGTLATYQHFPKKKKKILSCTASAGLIIGKNDAKGERGWKMKKRKENNVGPVDLSGVMWTEPRVRRLKTMLVFGRVGPRVAMGNTCGGVSRRPALRGKGGVLGRVVEGC